MRMTDPRLSTHGFWTRGFLVLGSLGVLFGVAEVVLRVFAPVRWMGQYHADWSEDLDETLLQPSEVPGLAYELVPGLELERWGDRVRINESGMRDGPTIENLPESIVRIAALGDEVTFGRLVGQNYAYPTVLENVLNGAELTPGCEFEVLNMGVSGYGIADAVRVLEHKCLRYDPDMILIGYRLDDPESDELQPMKIKLNGVPWWKHFHVARLWNQSSLERAVERNGDGDYFEYLHTENGKGWEKVLESFDLVRRMAHRANGEEIPVLLMLIPSFRDFSDWEQYSYSDLHERLAGEARQRGFDVLDLAKSFARRGGDPAELTEAADLPNVEGHRRIAVELMARLVHTYPCIGVR